MNKYPNLPIFISLFICFFAFNSSIEAAELLEFNKHIRPILSDNCFKCHGPDAGTRKPKSNPLRLDQPSDQIPWEAFIKRITSGDPNERMPPLNSGKNLSPNEIEVLKKWVQQGAKYEGHWAFLKIKKPQLPQVKNKKWIANPIDLFVLSKLEQQGLGPSAQAQPWILLRRLSLDVLGLPPTAEEIQKFQSSPSDGTYNSFVESYLKSPHYGEHFAVKWLDLVRYADSNGYHADLEWSVSPYRDWVIQAFNSNMRFDQFTREQIAGDLLTNSTLEQKIASGYNRLNMKSTEFGIQDKEYLAKYASDRVRTTASTWLGLTLGCAECHDHKFDPLSAKDFYSFSAFFADIKQMGYYPDAQRRGWGERIKVPSAENRRKLKQIERELTELTTQFDKSGSKLHQEQKRWELELQQRPQPNVILPDARQGGHPWKYTFTRPASDSWISVNFDDKDWKVGKGGFGTKETPNTHVRTVWKTKDIWQRTQFKVVNPESELHLYLHHDEDVSIYLNGNLIKQFTGYSTKYVNLPFNAEIRKHLKSGLNTLAVHCRQTSGGQYIDVGLSNMIGGMGSPEGIPNEILDIVKIESKKRSKKQSQKVHSYFKTVAKSLGPLRDKIKVKERAKKDLESKSPTTLITVAVPPRTIRVLERGDWTRDDGEIVLPQIPSQFGQLRLDRRANRLDLAQWLTSKENPLTARVFVNRLWKNFFGTGLSKVLDDLGSQGEWPSHPELLDYLAHEFISSGWNIQHVVRLIVTSNTYRQSSLFPKALRELDPYNRLLARQSRFRFSAETIRDNALRVSGLLNPKVGGPSVKPYQPAGYWDHLYFPKRTYQPSRGADQYRRALYTHWQRQFLHPAMKIFDAPPREECTAERPRSNTPLAALNLLNDPSQVEAARVLAQTAFKDPKNSTNREKLQWMGLRVLSRNLDQRELNILTKLFKKHLVKYTNDTTKAKNLLSIGFSPVPNKNHPELAAWTSVARTLLNLHEAITRN